MIKRGKMNKKGISPLIATVLIVGFTIALAGVAYIFLSDTIKEQIDKQGAESEGKSKCIGVDVSFVECSATTKIVKFKNGGKEGVAGFTFRLKQGTEPNIKYVTKQLQESIEAGDEREYEPDGLDKEGEAIPLVPAKGYAYPCADKIITFSCT